MEQNLPESFEQHHHNQLQNYLNAVNHPDHNKFNSLVERVQACRLCPRMEGRSRVLSKDNGALDARLMFIAEAPGRFGADQSKIPLVGDATGRNFEDFLKAGGISRSQIFVTNAVLCNPRDAEGRNAKPNRLEKTNCSHHLLEIIELLRNPNV